MQPERECVFIVRLPLGITILRSCYWCD